MSRCVPVLIGGRGGVIWPIAGSPEVGCKIPDEINLTFVHLGTDSSVFHKPGTELSNGLKQGCILDFPALVY